MPPLLPLALQQSTTHRLKGTDAFKLGNYSLAHESYTASLSHLPSTHPLIIVLLTNRALTSLKTGAPNAAVSDAEAAIALIGPLKGEGETIDLGAGDTTGPRSMKDYWGKAVMRKAEALEQLENFRDAKDAWKDAVEAGVGGAVAVQGRTRCERALQPKAVAHKPVSKPKPKPKPKPTVSALADLAPPAYTSTAAVQKLRAANAAADALDEEKFRLADLVDARLAAWRAGRADNLRALLGSLDTVLWPEAGWKKVGMHELVVNSKVKITYMKGVAKVHPDKVGGFFFFYAFYLLLFWNHGCRDALLTDV
jgi:hypothetical protein